MVLLMNVECHFCINIYEISIKCNNSIRFFFFFHSVLSNLVHNNSRRVRRNFLRNWNYVFWEAWKLQTFQIWIEKNLKPCFFSNFNLIDIWSLEIFLIWTFKKLKPNHSRYKPRNNLTSAVFKGCQLSKTKMRKFWNISNSKFLRFGTSLALTRRPRILFVSTTIIFISNKRFVPFQEHRP